jgi:acetolactate synthase-1/2/3 large subunit
LFPATAQNYAGDLGVGANPALVAAARDSDLIILLGTRLSEAASQGYTLLDIPRPAQRLVHIHPGAEELGRVYQPDLGLNVSPRAFLAAMQSRGPRTVPGRGGHVARLREAYLAWSGEPTELPGAFNLGEVVAGLSKTLPDDAIITNGAGNYATWINRFYRFRSFGSLVAPTSGSMGYGVPAAIGALRLDPSRPVVAFAGDGCFLMNGQEFATAVQYGLKLIVIVVDNGMYGTIRMHQERDYPERVVGTALSNPDFCAYAKAFGGYGERVETTAEFWPALERAMATSGPAILHCLVDPEALTPGRSLSAIRAAALKKEAAF